MSNATIPNGWSQKVSNGLYGLPIDLIRLCCKAMLQILDYRMETNMTPAQILEPLQHLQRTTSSESTGSALVSEAATMRDSRECCDFCRSYRHPHTKEGREGFLAGTFRQVCPHVHSSIRYSGPKSSHKAFFMDCATGRGVEIFNGDEVASWACRACRRDVPVVVSTML
jgi:hypothetical protein